MDYYGPEQQEMEHYAQWLAEQLEIYNVSRYTLAWHIGVNKRTIDRYLLMDKKKLPDSETMKNIERFFEEKSKRYVNFKRLPNDEFSQLVQILLKEFNTTQEQLANHVYVSSKLIHRICYHAAPADIGTQKAILEYFYVHCLTADESYQSRHYGTGIHLDALLHGRTGFSQDLINDWDIQIGQRGTYRKALQYILTLPVWLQDTIVECRYAFHNKDCETMDGGSFFLQDFVDFIERFRQLSGNAQRKIENLLAEYSFVPFPASGEDDMFYNMITDYRVVSRYSIKNRLERFGHIKDKPDEKRHDRFIQMFEGLFPMFAASDDDFIAEVSYKLTLSEYEWHIWMLLLIYWYKDLDFSRIYKKMDMPEEE